MQHAFTRTAIKTPCLTMKTITAVNTNEAIIALSKCTDQEYSILRLAACSQGVQWNSQSTGGGGGTKRVHLVHAWEKGLIGERVDIKCKGLEL